MQPSSEQVRMVKYRLRRWISPGVNHFVFKDQSGERRILKLWYSNRIYSCRRDNRVPLTFTLLKKNNRDVVMTITVNTDLIP